MRIGEVAERAGLAASAIRFYEQRGLLPEPERVRRERRYGPEIFERLAIIDVAQRAGFSLDEIRLLMTGFSADVPPSARWRVLAEKKLPEVDELLSRVREMKRILEEGVECGCLSLEQCRLLVPAPRPPSPGQPVG